MGRNVTFKLDDETMRLLRVRAAEREMSISKFVSEILEDELRRLEEARRTESASVGDDQ